MNFIDIIEHKKNAQKLTKEEIREFALGAANGSVPDYQLSALLMAIRLIGMDDEETTELTLAIAESGNVCDMSGISGNTVDKHSTGGVGDTTTLVLAPLVAACGGIVAKMSGRGLGHTGGTLDKLESIPGFNVNLSQVEFEKQVHDIGISVVGQSCELAPADKVLYSLRDVTSTVDSLPLIASSIMGKKLAGGSNSIVLDVKTGDGALMKTLDESIQLAELMVKIGTNSGRSVMAVISGMDEPLGTHIGNALEVKEAIDILANRTKGPLLDLSLILGSYMLMLSGVCSDFDTCMSRMKHNLECGNGLSKLRQMIIAQGGNPDCCDDVSVLPAAMAIMPVISSAGGYIQKMDTVALGNASQALGAGRRRKSDIIDPSVGFVMQKRIGDYVSAGDTIAVVYAKSDLEAAICSNSIKNAILLGKEKVKRKPIVQAVVTSENTIRYL